MVYHQKWVESSPISQRPISNPSKTIRKPGESSRYKLIDVKYRMVYYYIILYYIIYIFHFLMVIINLESCSIIHSNCWLDPNVSPYFSIFQKQNLWNIAPRSGCGRPTGARDEYRRPTGARKQQKRVKNGGFDRWIHCDLGFHQQKLGENHVEHGDLVVVELWTNGDLYWIHESWICD